METIDKPGLGPRSWVGRSERRVDEVTAAPAAALAATLDIDDAAPGPGAALPPLWHWLYFLPRALARDIGRDGHPQRGGFLPPVPLPRRMWAGGRLQFHRPLRIGEAITRESKIISVEAKTGRSGSLVFVGVQHELSTSDGIALVEKQDIVYRDAAQPGAVAAAALPAPDNETFRRDVTPDPVLLFRYSALTFNGHRIHYDRTYACETEGYPGLVVHGPLIATLLLDLLRAECPAAQVTRFAYKAVSPLFDLHGFALCGRADSHRRFSLWARAHDGALAMQATAETA